MLYEWYQQPLLAETQNSIVMDMFNLDCYILLVMIGI